MIFVSFFSVQVINASLQQRKLNGPFVFNAADNRTGPVFDIVVRIAFVRKDLKPFTGDDPPAGCRGWLTDLGWLTPLEAKKV